MNGYEFANKILDLYYLYENYCISNNEKLEINIDETKIKFSLFKNKEIIDELELTFKNKGNEKLLHDYTSLYLTSYVFGHINAHFKDNRIYNDIHRPYLDYRVESFPIMFNTFHFREFIEEEFKRRDVFEDLEFFYYKTQKKEYRNIDKILNKRIEISKKIIRGI